MKVSYLTSIRENENEKVRYHNHTRKSEMGSKEE